MVARLKGAGSSDEAANFSCVAAPDAVGAPKKTLTSSGDQR
jgi:hypothetical protein